MKIPTKISLKTTLVAIAISILVTSCVFYAFAASPMPATTFTISGGVFPGAPSYTIWKEGQNYFSKDDNGVLLAGADNASYVIQISINNLGEGGYIFLREGKYLMKSKVTVNRRIHLIGEGAGATTNFQYGMTILYLCNSFPDTCMFELAPSTGLTDTHWQIPIFQDICFYGNKANQAGQVDCFRQLNASAVDIQWTRCWFDSWKGHAIQLTCYGQHHIESCWFEHFDSNYEAIVSASTSTGYWYPHYVVVYRSHFYEAIPAFRNAGTKEVTHWSFQENTFHGSSVSDITQQALILNNTECFRVMSNTFRWLYAGIVLNSSSKSVVIDSNIFGGAGGDVSYPVAGTPNASYPSVIRDNRGFETEWSGVSTVVDDSWVVHNLGYYCGTPSVVQLTVQNSTDCYFAQVKSINSTHFQVYLREKDGSSCTDAVTIHWHVIWNPQ